MNVRSGAKAGDERRFFDARRTCLLVAGLAAVAILAVWLLASSHRPTGEATASREPLRSDGTGDAAATPEEMPPGASLTPLWLPLDESDVDPLPRYAPQWSTEGRVLVRVAEAARAAAGWRVGDRLTLPLPQLGVVYRPLIEELNAGPGPSISALGKVAGDDGRRRRFVVTVGPAHTFAYIDTPRGPYELMGGHEHGWLLPSSSMMAGFDFSKPDYVLPGYRGAGDGP